jgi:rod shape-determining protein MreC
MAGVQAVTQIAMSRVSSRSLILYILAALGVALLVLATLGVTAPIEGVASSAARPFLITFSGIGRQTGNVITSLRELRTLRSTNRQLQTIVDTLTIDNLRLKEVETENQRLRELLRFAQLNPVYDVRGGQVVARVISKGPSNYLNSITIDLGSEHGIEPGMPVVTERGLVGRILKVGPRTATVLLITDPSSGVQAMIQRESSREVGVVNGRAGEAPVMDYIAQDGDVTTGDLAITSGLGGAFPKNLVIGQVVEVRKRDYEMFQQATLRPTVNFDRLEFVLVITNFKPPPGQTDDPESLG